MDKTHMEGSSTRLSEKRAIAYLAIGTILIAIGPFFVEFSGLDAIGNSFYRMLIGGIAFLLLVIRNKQKLPPLRFFWLYMAAASTTAVDLFLCNQSILYIGSGLATVLSNLEVLFLILIGVIVYNEHLEKKLFATTGFLIALGICLLLQPYVDEMHPHLLLGVGYALCASFVFSLYLLALKTIGKENPTSSAAANLALICILSAAILALVIALLPSASFALPPTGLGIGCVLIYSLMSQVCGWWLISQGINKLKLSTTGVLFLLQPACTFFGDCFFLGRNTAVFQIIGCLILFAAVYRTIRAEERKKQVV